MKSSCTLALCLASAFLCVAGCFSSDPDDPASTESMVVLLQPQAGGGGYEPPAGLNGLPPSCLWGLSTQAELRVLATGRLDAGGGALPPMSGLSGACRGLVLKALIQCALTPELSIEDPLSGTTYEGHWGVAPDWLKNPLDPTGRRWVTACMLEKLNAGGVQVPILMEGAHSRLQFDADLDPHFPMDDSTAFGDMFSSTNPLKPGTPPFDAYVCTEDDTVAICGGADFTYGWAELRICDGTASGGCGMIYLGHCSSVCSDVGGYWQCPDSDGNTWTETIRVQFMEWEGVCL